jgi:hypothetical protein
LNNPASRLTSPRDGLFDILGTATHTNSDATDTVTYEILLMRPCLLEEPFAKLSRVYGSQAIAPAKPRHSTWGKSGVTPED